MWHTPTAARAADKTCNERNSSGNDRPPMYKQRRAHLIAIRVGWGRAGGVTYRQTGHVESPHFVRQSE
jgi:hypothetical protein